MNNFQRTLKDRLRSDETLGIGALQEIDDGKLELVKGDITRVDLRQLFGNDPHKRESQKVVANLPFNITTDVLKLLLPLGDVICEIYVMLQVRHLIISASWPCVTVLSQSAAERIFCARFKAHLMSGNWKRKRAVCRSR